MSTRTAFEPGYAAVVVGGSERGLKRAARRLMHLGYALFTTSDFRAVLDDVRASSLPAIEEVLAECGCTIEAVHDEKDIEVQVPKARPRRAFRLSLQPGKWYFAENAEDENPLVFVRDQSIKKVADGEGEQEVQVFLVELFNPDDGLPVKAEFESRELVKFGLRPATINDFRDLDLVPPEFGDLVLGSVKDPQPKTSAARHFGRLR